MKNSISSVLIFPVFLLLSCAVDKTVGTGSETINCLAGSVLNPDKTPEPDAVVQLIPESFDIIKDGPLPSSLIDTTDENGTYSFTRIVEGGYTINARSSRTATAAIITDVNISKDTVFAPDAELEKTGTIRIVFTDNITEPNSYVYIPGTSLYSMIESGNNEVIIESVPPGVIPEILQSWTDRDSSFVIRRDVEVTPDDTVILANHQWKFNQRIYLNTSPTGAEINGDIYEFPLLIRLNKDNFDFGQAGSDGADIRFTKPDNSFLSFEIERWDSGSKTAEVWVRIDTIRANDTSQYITMYWGNDMAQQESSDTAVFGTRYGWAGVWHLAEDAPDTGTERLYKNSAENSNHGKDLVLSQRKEGLIGQGQLFVQAKPLTSDSIQIVPDMIPVYNATTVLKPQYLTVSAWVKIKKLDGTISEILSMGDNYLLRLVGEGYFHFVIFSDNGINATCNDYSLSLADSMWHFIVCTYDGNEVRGYVDGVLRSTVPFTDGIGYGRGADFVIGAHGTHKVSFNMDGSIDEVRVSSVARSEDWIRLSFENQRTNSRLLSFQ